MPRAVPRRPLPLLLALAAVLAVPSVGPLAASGSGGPVGAAAAAPGDPPAHRVPEDLPGDARTLRDALGDLRQAEDLDEARAAYDRARSVGPAPVEALADLGEEDGRLLLSYWAGLRTEMAAGNLSNARSLAGAAAGLLEDELVPAADDWAQGRTTVTPGLAEATSTAGRVRVAVVLLHPPPGGLGAMDVEVQVDPARVRPADASPAVGRGNGTVDPGNGTARFASFDPQALAGLGTGSQRVVALGHVILEAAGADVGDDVRVDVTVRELADPDAAPVPAVSPAGNVTVTAAATGGLLDGLGSTALALGAVVVLGAGAVWSARRFLEV